MGDDRSFSSKKSPESAGDWLPVGLSQKKVVGAPLSQVNGYIPQDIPLLFTPLKIRGTEFQNRIVVAPMCMYSCEAEDGLFSHFHLAHLGNLGLRGPSLVFTEATAVTPEGRLSPRDTGIWNDEQMRSLASVAALVKASGSKLGIQLAHGGRKAGTWPPYHNYEESGGLLGRGIVPNANGGFSSKIIAPSPIPWKDRDYPTPNEMTTEQVKEMVRYFVKAAERSVAAGVDVIEIHAAHGYLIHEFLSGNTNKRKDEYGGSFSNRIRFLLEIISGVRSVMPSDMPLFCRVSGTDYTSPGEELLGPDPEGWDIAQVTELCRLAAPLGLDLIDISSGGNVPTVSKGLISNEYGYQLPLAATVKGANIPNLFVASVGALQDAKRSEAALKEGKTDFIFIARHFIRDPSWVYTAGQELGVKIRWADQYSWMWPVKS